VGAGIFGAITTLPLADLVRGTGRYNLAQGTVGGFWQRFDSIDRCRLTCICCNVLKRYAVAQALNAVTPP
jgi:hypothetical protein